jgi:hypothetical protein
MKRALGILGLVLGLGMLVGCEALLTGPEDSYEQEAALPPESYRELPHRNEEITTTINLNFGYQLMDPTDAELDCIVFESDLLVQLNKCGVKDGNTFIAPKPGRNPQLLIRTTIYLAGYIGNVQQYRYVTEFWAFGHREPITQIKTSDDSTATLDLSREIYSWIIGGWHTKDLDR